MMAATEQYCLQTFSTVSDGAVVTSGDKLFRMGAGNRKGLAPAVDRLD